MLLFSLLFELIYDTYDNGHHEHALLNIFFCMQMLLYVCIEGKRINTIFHF